RAQVLNLLTKLQKRKGLTYLFIAHDLSVVRYITDRVAIIYKGKIVELAETEELFKNPLHPYTRALISAIPLPDPRLEKNKKITLYDPSVHNYKLDPPKWVEIRPNHFILANSEEVKRYEKLI
ncbi:MAG TPA: ABC transporter ATP-binding protein, partial [Tissierellaceae bacterium]|nr:ABC transporter ATP-binding protein [Tissierellaceae bacterium]